MTDWLKQGNKEETEKFFTFKILNGDTLKSPLDLGFQPKPNPGSMDGLWALREHNQILSNDTFYPSTQIVWVRFE